MPGELNDDTVFPTSFDTVMRLRKALQDRDIWLDKLASLITLDPLVCARLIALTSSAAYNPGSGQVRDLNRDRAAGSASRSFRLAGDRDEATDSGA